MGGVTFVAGDTTGPTRTTHCPIDALQRTRVSPDAAGIFAGAGEGQITGGRIGPTNAERPTPI